MKTPLSRKSSVAAIARRFDRDVERFSNLDTGQSATMDAPLAMELITKAAIAATPTIRRVLDIGCGAGNNTIKLLREYGRGFSCHLCDLSRPMLVKAEERIRCEACTGVEVFHGDFRAMEVEAGAYDVVLAAAVLHHLRDDADWRKVFRKIHRALRPGGSVWISDLVAHETAAVDRMMTARYGQYLEALRGAGYRNTVLAYIDEEDSPRPVSYQLDLLRAVGFTQVDILHKNSCFAAFGAVKGTPARVRTRRPPRRG